MLLVVMMHLIVMLLVIMFHLVVVMHFIVVMILVISENRLCGIAESTENEGKSE
jgi:hypothetical protein